MNSIYVSSLRDEGDIVFKLAEEFQLGVEIQGFMEPHKMNDFAARVEITNDKVSNIKQRSLHGPFLDLFPSSKDPEIIKVVNKRFLDAYKAAKIFNAKHLIFHAGFISKAFFVEDWLKNSINFWEKFLSVVDEDIEIHIENVCEDDYSIIHDLIKSINSPRFSACLDIGHANINSSRTLEEWIKGLNNDIRYVHLHNNDGVSDSHLGLCNGKIDILKTLELLQIYAPNSKWSLETKLSETEQSILWLLENDFIAR